ncbi:MAG: HEAT repeat domain-containing protein [Waddliaceae bacterium]|nr:HEAT repeat domain-containing protein [Waddliaceae bacterium]MBT3579569.1 HEAT repeat domain-containing protein [Waddliaceae bacterium]MBT4444431.1 HEAT repeat domain-containing protein [Waddliaceae bacterium]MBT6928176.1 HEAT repeat domain-containing protein [Waddliaceae bacterium]MBT7263952.1 HEAT repeat domain-containing protein [Waddliaceae bacterium]
MARWHRFFLASFVVVSTLCGSDAQEDIEKVRAHIVIGDVPAAIREAREGVKRFPDDEDTYAAFVGALALEASDKEIVAAWKDYSTIFPEGVLRDAVLEDMAWGIVRNGSNASSVVARLSSMVGAVSSNDIRAVNILIKNMRGANSFLRGVAVKLAPYLRDSALKEELLSLLDNERDWYVRLAVIESLGEMHVAEITEKLESLLDDERTMAEIKIQSIEALGVLVEDNAVEEIRSLAQSDRAILRTIACRAAFSLGLGDAVKDDVYDLLDDNNAEVRAAALYVVGCSDYEDIEQRIEERLDDNDYHVAITAAWALVRNGIATAEELFPRWLSHENSDVRRFAAAVLATTGKYGVALAYDVAVNSEDIYVRANSAYALIGQREHVDVACEALYVLLDEEYDKIMWEGYGIFKTLMPSDVAYDERIPNYPEVVNQMTRLDVLKSIAMFDGDKAQTIVQRYLKEHFWGITGFAALTLLEEGNDEAIDAVRLALNDDDEAIRAQAALVMALWGKDPSVISVLHEAYHDADRELKIIILEALGSLGDKQSVPFLVEALDTPFQSMRIVAASALIQCGNH